MSKADRKRQTSHSDERLLEFRKMMKMNSNLGQSTIQPYRTEPVLIMHWKRGIQVV